MQSQRWLATGSRC